VLARFAIARPIDDVAVLALRRDHPSE